MVSPANVRASIKNDDRRQRKGDRQGKHQQRREPVPAPLRTEAAQTDANDERDSSIAAIDAFLVSRKTNSETMPIPKGNKNRITSGSIRSLRLYSESISSATRNRDTIL
jgi:hypothetical protein